MDEKIDKTEYLGLISLDITLVPKYKDDDTVTKIIFIINKIKFH